MTPNNFRIFVSATLTGFLIILILIIWFTLNRSHSQYRQDVTATATTPPALTVNQKLPLLGKAQQIDAHTPTPDSTPKNHDQEIDENNYQSQCTVLSRWFPNRFISDWSGIRDRRALYDPLYPPENRTDSLNYNIMYDQVQNRNMYVPTNSYDDTFRMIGFLSNKNRVNGENSDFSKGGDVWKLMARQTDNNRSQFYIIPSNNDYSIKVPITDDIVKGYPKIRNIFDIPNEITFDTPLLSSSPYVFTELPKNDWNNSGYY